MTLLCGIDEAARECGVPAASLRSAAEKHGFLVRMGRAIRLERNRLPELIVKCRDQPKDHASTNSSTATNGISGIQATPTAQRAAQAAQKLKKRSVPTSPQKGAQVLRLDPRT